MKHFRLLLTLLTLTIGWTNASAQTWTGNEVTDGTFYLFNVGAQKYLNNGDPNQSWGTNAYLQAGFGLDVTLTKISDGIYTIDTNVSNGGDSHYLNSTTWCDGAATNWTFTPIAEGSTIYMISSDESYLVANDDLNDVVYGPLSSTEANNQWMLVSENDFKTAMQVKAFSSTDPMDVSIFIKGRSFARNDGRNSYWTRTNTSSGQWIEGVNNKYYGNEYYYVAFDVYQDITDLPEGTYEVRCSGFGSTGSSYVYGNNQQGALTTENSAANGSRGTAYQLIMEENAWADQSSGTFVVGDGNLRVGIKNEDAQGWTVYDEFRLYYYGLDLSEFASVLANAVSDAEALEGKVPTTVYNELKAVVNENNQTYTTAADYTAATNAIIAATETAQAFVAPYSRYTTVKTAVVGISSTINTADADAQAEAATTAEALDEAVATLRAALLIYLPTAEANEDNPIDLTNALIDNPSVSENVGYWTVTDVVRANQWGSGPTTNYGETEFYQSNFNIYQALTLCKGTFEFGVTGFHRAGNHATYFYAGEDRILIPGVESSVVNSMAEAKTYFDNGNGKVALKFALENESNTLNVGIVNNDTETDRWTIFRNFTLKYYGSQVDLSSYVELLASAVTAANAVEGTVPSAVYQALSAVVTENNKEYDTKDAYLTAIAAIEEATATAKTMQDPYNRYIIVKTAVVAISETISTSEADTQADAATNAEELDGAVATLRTNLLAYLPTAEVAEGSFIDLTNALIDNPTVRQNTDYWTAEGTPNTSYSWGVVNYEECEFYYQNFDFYQTLTLCNGTYEFGVTGFHRAGNHATYFYAGEDKVLIPGVESSVVNSMDAAKTYFDAGNGKVALKFALEDESNNIKIGIVNNDTETDRWTIFRDFTLKYYGSQVDLSSYEEAWNEAVAAAEAAIAANPNVTGEELTAVNTAKADVPEQTKESYMTKTEALTNATAALVAAAPSYNLYVEKKVLIDNFEALPYADPAKKPSTEEAETPTNAEDAATKANTLQTALRLYVESNALAEGVEGAVDMTSKILNNNNPENTSNWTADLNLGENVASFVVNSGQPYTAGDGTTGGKYFDGGAATWGNDNWEALISQDIMLVPGRYVLSVTSRAQANVNKYNLFAGENKVEMGHIGSAADAGIFGNGFNDYYVEFEVTAENPTITIGIEVGAAEAYTWYSFSRFRLAQLEENAEYATDEDLTLLTESLQPTAKLGFDEGDYAPYNNVESLTAAEAEIEKVYAEMEAFGGKATQATVVAATQVISQLNWVDNTEEVNAVYDGNFALAQVVETSTDNEITKGWSNPAGIRQIIGTIENFPGLADASAGKAAFSWNGTYNYGEAQGYTMPLKAKTTYKFSIKYTGWSGQNLNNGADVYIYNPDGTTLATEAMGVVENNIANENSLKSYTLEFTTGEAGNYVLGLNPKGNWVFTDVSIFRAKTKKGDVNGDGQVDVADVTALVNALQPEAEKPAAADVDGDSDVDADDVKALVELVLKEE